MDFFMNNDSTSNSCVPDTNCSMNRNEPGEFEVVAILRLIMACLSILGAVSIIGSALYRKTVCNPKVHPLFVLSIADMILSVLWISGAVVWLRREIQEHILLRFQVGCFSITLLTVILQCVTMNLTLVYALLAYSSIKQRDFSGVYMVQQGSMSVHVWPPLCSFIAYFIAWVLPVVLIMIPFGVLSEKYQLVKNANKCSCGCLPYFGNMIPRPFLHPSDEAQHNYVHHLHFFIASYATMISANFLVVFACMLVLYWKVFRRIRRMRKTQEQNETTPLFGATQAMILEGQKDAKKRVLLFLAVFFITGFITFAFAIKSITETKVHAGHHHTHRESRRAMRELYIFLLLEAIFVPIQGFLNAVVYGWTRGDFLNVMSSQQVRTRADSFALSYDAMEREGERVEDDGEESEHQQTRRTGNSILFLSTSQEVESGVPIMDEAAHAAMTPVLPGFLLGEEGERN